MQNMQKIALPTLLMESQGPYFRVTAVTVTQTQ